MLKHILCFYIRRHLDNHEILGPESRGINAKLTTETQLLFPAHDMMKSRDVKNQREVIILDFWKAFDTVPHRRLKGKLEYILWQR